MLFTSIKLFYNNASLMDLIHRECMMKLIKMFSIDAKQVSLLNTSM